MTFTYNGDPSESTTTEVRFLIGDTDENDQLLQDEEIEYILVVHPDAGATSSNYAAASACAEAIAASFAKKMDKSVGSASLTYSQRYQHYVELADRLKSIAQHGPTGQRPPNVGAPELFGGGDTYLGPDDSPHTYKHDDIDYGSSASG